MRRWQMSNLAALLKHLPELRGIAGFGDGHMLSSMHPQDISELWKAVGHRRLAGFADDVSRSGPWLYRNGDLRWG